MTVQRVGVSGGTPTWRRGIIAVLDEAGHAVAELPTLGRWRPGKGGTAVIVHIDSSDELEHVTEFRNEHPHIAVITVSPEVGVAEFAASIRAGAASAVPEDVPIDTLVTVLEHVTTGMSSAPPPIMRAMAMRVAAGFGEALSIDQVDVERLRALANGWTVAQIASEAGFSEREMFRLLNTLYGRLGVKNRTEAILWASRHGFLDEPESAAGRA